MAWKMQCNLGKTSEIEQNRAFFSIKNATFPREKLRHTLAKLRTVRTFSKLDSVSGISEKKELLKTCIMPIRTVTSLRIPR